jgi:type VI secretion system protein ImpA
MASIDVDAVLVPVGDAEPSGPDLEYDPEFRAMESAAQGKPQQQMGSTIVPGEDPDWKVVHRHATALLQKTRDLRVGIYLLKALARTSGWTGIGDSLAVLHGLVDRFWDQGLHPRPDGDQDPIRINALSELDAPEVLAAIRMIPLCSSPVVGPLTLRQIEIATGESAPPEGTEPISMAAVEGTFAECPLDALQATDAGLRKAAEALAGIESTVGAKGEPPNLERLARLLRKAGDMVRDALARRTAVPAGAPQSAGEVRMNEGSNASRMSFSGEITSREDVLKALDRICAYYAKYEPSSPIPMFMERSKKLVVMSFVDIVNELVPDAAKQVDVLRGYRE